LAQRIEDAANALMPLLHDAQALVWALVSCSPAISHALDIAAGTERLACTRDQKRSDGVVRAALGNHAPKCRRQLRRQRIARLGPVQREGGDAMPYRAQELLRAGIDLALCSHDRDFLSHGARSQ